MKGKEEGMRNKTPCSWGRLRGGGRMTNSKEIQGSVEDQCRFHYGSIDLAKNQTEAASQNGVSSM